MVGLSVRFASAGSDASIADTVQSSEIFTPDLCLRHFLRTQERMPLKTGCGGQPDSACSFPPGSPCALSERRPEMATDASSFAARMLFPRTSWKAADLHSGLA